jgi:hypothetical protein
MLDDRDEALADAADLRRKWERENPTPAGDTAELVRKLRRAQRIMENGSWLANTVVRGWADLMGRAADELERSQR